MPQMAPYNWLHLFLLFSTIQFYLISYIYFMKNNLPPSKKKINKIPLSWKW